ncbi:MAG: translation elongation factor-like protein [Anaerolineales bacterium]|jgi:putative protease
MDIPIGTVTHYYEHLMVAVLSFTGKLNVGDTIHILGHTTDFTQIVESMEIEHKKIESVNPGDESALKMAQHVREKDRVYKVVEEKT